MTAYDLWRAALRRWYILVVGASVTLMVAAISPPETVYWATVELRVAAPLDPVAPKTLEDPDIDLVSAATVLITLVNAGHVETKSASPDATLYGEGKREAVVARLRDYGGQWRTSIPDAVIDVQAVDSNPGAVRAALEGKQASLAQLLNEVQDDLHVAPSQRISLVLPSGQPEVVQVTGSRARAAASTLPLGLLLTFAVVYWLEMRSRRRPPPGGPDSHRDENRESSRSQRHLATV